MNDRLCSKCNNRFYSAYMRGEMVCPYCGFSATVSEGKKRAAERALLKRGCTLVTAGQECGGETFDLSAMGAGVRLGGGVSIKERDTLKIIIEGLEISSSAEVVWVRQAEAGRSVGLRFLEEINF